MSVGVLLLTHPGIGTALLHIAARIVGGSPLQVKCLDVPPDAPLKPVCERARSMIKVLNRGGGVLVLTDIYGATPHNVAEEVACKETDTTVVSGLNLPMLVRVFNYPGDNLDTLASKAAEGGARGIMCCPLISVAAPGG